MKKKEKIQSSLLVDIVARMEEEMKHPKVMTLPLINQELTPEERAKRKEELIKRWEHRLVNPEVLKEK
jgi:hypothetical protein